MNNIHRTENHKCLDLASASSRRREFQSARQKMQRHRHHLRPMNSREKLAVPRTVAPSWPNLGRIEIDTEVAPWKELRTADIARRLDARRAVREFRQRCHLANIGHAASLVPLILSGVHRPRAVLVRSPTTNERTHENGTDPQPIVRLFHVKCVSSRLKMRHDEIVHWSQVRMELDGEVYA